MKKLILAISVLFLSLNSSLAQLNPPGINGFFKEGSVPRIDIEIPPANLALLLEDISSDTEYKARFIYNDHLGTCDTIEDVGFRIRGNVSRTVEKKSFKISINTFAPGRKYYDLEKINLKATGDDSFIREKLSWYLCQQMGIPSIWVNHVMLYINDEPWGVYTNIEHIDEEFAGKEFGNKNGNLYKCRYPATLEWISDNQQDYKFEHSYFGDRMLRAYELKTNTEADDYGDLVDFTRDLQDTEVEDYKVMISEKININSLLKFFALEVYLGHWDSYSLPATNYFLYHNTATNKFEYITTDMDLTMGVFFYSGDDMTMRHIYDFTNEGDQRPLRTNILAIPEFRDNYTFYLKQLITAFPPDSIRKLAEEIQDFIYPYVALDPYMIFAEEDFYGALDNPFGMSPYGIIEFFSLRYNAILEQLDDSNTSPIISNVIFNNIHVGNEVKISCTVTDDDADPLVKIFYQLNDGEELSAEMSLVAQGKMMGVSNYELILGPLGEPGVLSFHIEAKDAQDQTRRMPYVEEEHLAIFPDDPKLIINEIMASNIRSITDEFGEREDWIEIYNADNTAISLGNKYLSDSYFNPDESPLPDILLQPGQAAWFWADDEPDQGDMHARFRLSRNGETVYLFEELDDQFVLLDSMSFMEQDANISYGILPGETGSAGPLSRITPGYQNDMSGLAFLVFDVNMSQAAINNDFDPGLDMVDVIGDFNNWMGSERFYDTNKDSIYTHTIFDLSMGETMYYRFRLNQDNNKMEFSDVPGSDGHRSVLLREGCNSIYLHFNDLSNEILRKEIPETHMYPNPVADQLYISLDQGIKEVMLIDLNGRILKRIDPDDDQNMVLDMQDLTPGLYFIKFISDSKQSWVEKVIRQ